MEYKKDTRTKNLTLRDIHVGDWVQVWSKIKYVIHKSKKDGTMSQINQHIEGRTIISIRKI